MLVSQVPASLAPKTFRARQTRHQRAIVSTSASGSQYPASFEKADATPCSGELRGQSGEAPPTHGLPLGRRSAMATIASLGATAWLPAPPAFADDGAAAVQLSGVDVDLEKRLTTTEGVGWPGPFNGPYVGQARARAAAAAAGPRTPAPCGSLPPGRQWSAAPATPRGAPNARCRRERRRDPASAAPPRAPPRRLSAPTLRSAPPLCSHCRSGR